MKLSNTTPAAHTHLAGSNELTMSSREIAKLVESRHDSVKRTIERLAERGTIELPPLVEISTATKPISEYLVNKRDSYVIVAQLSPEFTARLVDRWQDLESKTLFTLPDFTNPAIAARAWADEVEAKQKALEIIDKQQSSIAEKDNLILASNEASIKAGEILVREFVKSVDIVDLGEKQFYQWMKKHKLIMDNRQPYQQYVNRGFFTWKPTEEKHGGEYRYTLRITPRGRVWLAAKYMSLLDQDFTI